MKILFVLPYVPSLIRVRPFQFIRELSLRHEVDVLATASSNELRDIENLRPFCGRIDIIPLSMVSRLRFCAEAALRGEPLQAAACRSTELERVLLERLATDPPDVVHVEHLRAAYVAKLVPRTMPVVFDAVDCISLLLERTLARSHRLEQRALALMELHRTRAYEARLLPKFDRVFATSPDDAGALQALSSACNVGVVTNGVDLEYFRPVADRDAATLVFSGKMSYHANASAALHFVRHIWPRIRERTPNTRLRIAGSNPPADIRALERDPAITVSGHVPDIREEIGRSTVAVCPMTVKVGVQNKLLEAMAMGLPAVSTTLGVAGLNAEPGRDLLVADDPIQFAEDVCRLLQDGDLRTKLGQRARGYVENHHRWEMAVARLEAIYEQASLAR
jgi:polysaccharide biosynthesis protein PslH